MELEKSEIILAGSDPNANKLPPRPTSSHLIEPASIDKLHITTGGKEGRALKKRLAAALGFRSKSNSSASPSPSEGDDTEDTEYLLEMPTSVTSGIRQLPQSMGQPLLPTESSSTISRTSRKTRTTTTPTNVYEEFDDIDDSRDRESDLNRITREKRAQKHLSHSAKKRSSENAPTSQSQNSESKSHNHENINHEDVSEDILLSYGVSSEEAAVQASSAGESAKLLRRKLSKDGEGIFPTGITNRPRHDLTDRNSARNALGIWKSAVNNVHMDNEDREAFYPEFTELEGALLDKELITDKSLVPGGSDVHVGGQLEDKTLNFFSRKTEKNPQIPRLRTKEQKPDGRLKHILSSTPPSSIGSFEKTERSERKTRQENFASSSDRNLVSMVKKERIKQINQRDSLEEANDLTLKTKLKYGTSVTSVDGRTKSSDNNQTQSLNFGMSWEELLQKYSNISLKYNNEDHKNLQVKTTVSGSTTIRDFDFDALELEMAKLKLSVYRTLEEFQDLREETFRLSMEVKDMRSERLALS